MATNESGIATPTKRYNSDPSDPFATAGGMYSSQITTQPVPGNPRDNDPLPNAAPPSAAPAPAPSAAGSYNTTPGWQDPNTAPTPDDPYYAEWAAGNVGNDKASAPGVGPQLNRDNSYYGGYSGAYGDANMLDQIKKWSQMPGADPSLASNPNYWLGAIKEKGGLNANNLQYWQDASVGDKAFFRNPNREQGGNQFADPSYQKLMDLVNARLASLSQPNSFPQLDQLMSMLKQNQGDAKVRAQQFADQLNGRVSQLQTPLLSQADVANRNAMASNGLIAQRDASLKNQREQRFASGFAPTSGLVAGDERATNEQYNNRQAQIDASLRNSSIMEDEARKNQATQLQGLAQQALQGGDVTALNEQAQMSDLENQLFNQDQNRQRELLTTGNIPVDLTNMGYSNAFNAANMGSNPLSSIMQLLGGAQTQQGLQQNASNSNMSALAWLLQQALH